MRTYFLIVLCVVFSIATLNVFGQKPNKPLQQVTPTMSQTASVKPAVVTSSCWTITGENGDIEYRWDTEINVKKWINEMRNKHNERYTYTLCNHPTVEACDANNEKVQPKKCWKITAIKNGQGIEQYLWSTETVARRKVYALQGDGYKQAKYVETPSNDEKSCGMVETEPSCWEITIENTVTFYWGFESDVQAIVNEARGSGNTATYMKTDKSKDSCIK